MKILITHAYAKDNKGDAAILSVLLSQLKTIFPSSEIKISTHDDVSVNRDFERVENISSFSYLAIHEYKNIIIKTLFLTYIFTSTFIWALIYRLFKINFSIILTRKIKRISKEFKSSDLIVAIGGGYIRSKPTLMDTINLLIVLHPIFLSLILKKKIILYSQSIGPLSTSFQRFVAKFVLNRVNLIMAREDHTLEALEALGIRKEILIRTIDVGFLFEGKSDLSLQEVMGEEVVEGKILVGITVRKWLTEEKQKYFELEIAKFIDLITKDANVLAVFIPQVSSELHNDDDRDVASRILAQVKNKYQVVNLREIYTHHEIKSFYKSLDFIVGTRFHSVIFSLTSYVPAIAIEYEYKTSGIMKDLGLSKWVIKMEDVTAENLFEKFENLKLESDKYKELLRLRLPVYKKGGEEILKYVKNTYEN